jgi:AAA ATPase domain
LRVVLLEGESGIGKSSLFTRLRERLESQGWLVASGVCPDDVGTPAAYAWTEALRALDARVSAGPALAPFLDGKGETKPELDAAGPDSGCITGSRRG